MVEYNLNVKDRSDPQSRLVFFNRLEKFLEELRNNGTILGYTLSTPYGNTIIFKVEAES